MTDTNNANLIPVKEKEYELYSAWRSLPAFFKNPPKNKDGSALSPREFCMTLGIDDEEIFALAEIPNQKAFAERHGLDVTTLVRWNKELNKTTGLDELRVWAKGLSKNVLMALYNTAIRKGFAIEAKLWFQLVESWEEKQKVEHDYRGVVNFTVIKANDKPIIAKTDGHTVVIDQEAGGSMGLPPR